MAKNTKAVRTLNKLLDAGYDTEKSILSMSMEDMLRMPGITVTELAVINELQKHVKSNKVITFLGRRHPQEAEQETDSKQQADIGQGDSEIARDTEQKQESSCELERREYGRNYHS
ncbi:hypothetical protein [Faecalicatena contorta]|uniref:hypothetical protein n=1 Tax=Lachnospiraceae TaxID=186803 RepID=UPI00046E967F